MFQLGTYVACIAEGSQEAAILDILLDNDLLIFDRGKMIDGQVLRCRSASSFESNFLRKGYEGKITVFRIHDSRRENFKLSKAYTHKVDVVNIITAPEIEMLIILSENKYIQFKKMKLKPSLFCKIHLNYHNVKSYEFTKKYFSDSNVLVNAIKEYVRVSQKQKGENTLLDLLK